MNSLPPNVDGKIRGLLEIQLITISLNNFLEEKREYLLKNKQKNNAINYVQEILLKVLWWGELQQNSHQILLNLNKKVSNFINNNKFPINFQYNIRTSAKLFANYLKNCEPIEFKFQTKISNLNLGQGFLRIPNHLIQFCMCPAIGESTDLHIEKNQIKIFNQKNCKIGEICVNLKMVFYESILTPVSTGRHDPDRNYKKFAAALNQNTKEEEKIDSVPYRRKSVAAESDACAIKFKENFETKINKNNECMENQQLVPELLLTSGRKCKDSKGNSARSSEINSKNTPLEVSSRIMDYFSGRPMSKMEEVEIMREIHNTSPLGNVLKKLPIKNCSLKKFYPHDFEPDNLYSIYLSIEFLQILHRGMKHIRQLTGLGDFLKSSTFSIESRISPNLFESKGSTIDFERFYSDSYNKWNQKIYFNRCATRLIKFNHIEHSDLIFTIWWREFGSRQSSCLGTANFRFTDLYRSNELKVFKKLSIKLCTTLAHVADLVFEIKLGRNGQDFRSMPAENFTKTPFEDNNSEFNHIYCKSYSDHVKKTPNTPDNNKNNVNNIIDDESRSKSTQTNNIKKSSADASKDISGSQISTIKNANLENFCILKGLMHVDSVKNVQKLTNGGHFLVCRAFWKQMPSASEFADDNKFNYIETFPVINDENFLTNTKNNHIAIELWQKNENSTEKLVGLARLPLHQFFIAFRDSTITNHLGKQKQPVVSIDGWVPIVSPLEGNNCGQMKALLAMGTSEQIELLKISRNLSTNDYLLQDPAKNIPVPELPKLFKNTGSKNDFSPEGEKTATIETKTKLSSVLGNFLENLSKQIPCTERIPECSSNSNTNTQRSTSELLEVLTKALSVPPKLNEPIPEIKIPNMLNPKFCKILLEIESALHIPPKNVLKLSGKLSKISQKKPSNSSEESSSYVTFQAEEANGKIYKSHEGMVYATHIVENCSNPTWGSRFEVLIPIDLLINDEKRFILKVWRKAISTSVHQDPLEPTPLMDSIIGFTSIDLNVLIAGMSYISGYFNIVDFSERINGQLKIKVEPIEDLRKLRPSQNLESRIEKNSSKKCTSVSDHESNVDKNLDVDLSNICLSRAIKRKFTELEEITQTLRARLELVVTNEGEEFDDEIIDADEEFERDLNTVYNDGDSQLGWLKNVDVEKDDSNTNSNPQ